MCPRHLAGLCSQQLPPVYNGWWLTLHHLQAWEAVGFIALRAGCQLGAGDISSTWEKITSVAGENSRVSVWVTGGQMGRRQQGSEENFWLRKYLLAAASAAVAALPTWTCWKTRSAPRILMVHASLFPADHTDTHSSRRADISGHWWRVCSS